MKLYYIILFLLPSLFCFSQNIDSLKNIANSDKNNKMERVRAYYELSNLDDENLMELNCKQALSLLNTIDSTKIGLKDFYTMKGNIIGNLGYYYRNKGIIKKAFDKYYSALNYSEKLGSQNLYADMQNNIGMLHYSQKQYKESVPFYLKAIEIYKNLRISKYEASSYMNLAGAYQHLNKFSLAILNFKKALNMFILQKDSLYIGFACNNIAMCFKEYKMQDSSFRYLNISLPLFEKLKAEDELAWTYDILGSIHASDKEFNSAEKYCLKCLSIAEKRNLPSQIASCSYNLYLINKHKGDFKKALVFYCKADSIQDSLINIDTRLILAKNEIEYSFIKKEEAITLESSKKSLQFEDEQKRSQIILFSIIAILAVSVFFGYMIFKSLKLEKQAKQIVLVQKDIIEEKQKEIVDSINYAKRIQYSLLANNKLLQDNLPSHFLFFKPKDVVSGDFYWGSKLSSGNFILATADSTGHGVPGAIMSMLNISCLNEAVNADKLFQPADILNATRKKIIEHLSNDGSAEGGKDGMDCSLVSFDFKNNKLTYSAANNPVWIIREKTFIALTADRMPVGKHDKDTTPFTQNEFDLQSGDMVYTLTDGFPDQFGGPKGKKFKYKQLGELLISISHESMEKQKQILTDTLNKWKGDLEQVDDICIIGVMI